MTKTLVVALGLVAFAGCSNKKEEGTVQKTTEAPVAQPPPAPPAPTPLVGTALADRYKSCVAMVNDGKLDAFRKDCLDDSYLSHDVGAGTGDRKGADAVIEYLKGQRTAFPDWKLDPQIVAVSGRTITSVLLATGTHTGPLKGPAGELAPTNKKIGLLMFHRVSVNDANKGTEEWLYFDPATMMGQLGAAPKDATSRPALDKGIEGAPIVVAAADDAKEKANVEVVGKATEALNAKKLPDASALMTADAVMSDQVDAKDQVGTKEIEARTNHWFAAFSDAKLASDLTVAAGDYVMRTAKFSGTHDGDLGKLKKTGKKIDHDFAEVIQLKDGKITKLWRFHSGAQFAQQLGLTPAAPAAPQPEKKM
jgi:predicted ester cyclase